MSGGLASWLDDESSCEKHKPRVPLLTANPNGGVGSSTELSIIDVDGAPPEAAPAAKGGTKSDVHSHITLRKGSMSSSAEKPAWDPFGPDSTCGARENAFARLRQGAAAGRSAASSASTPSPPASRDPAASSSWDPFACAGEDGKENRNAFSKLFAAASQHGSQSKGKSGGGGPSSAKRKRPTSRVAAPNAARAGGVRGAAEAATRFCECPVCGKKVIIELCSKHLDTECGGPDARSASAPTTDAADPPLVVVPDGPGSAEPLPQAALSSAAASSSSVVVISDRSPPRQEPAWAKRSPAPSSLSSSSVPRPRSSSPPPAAITAATAATAASATKPAASRKRRTARGAPGGKGPAVPRATAAAGAGADAEAEAIIPCPVCGEHVRADLCSWHLDTDCAGGEPAADGKGADTMGDDGEEGGRGDGPGGGTGAQKKDGKSEAEGGLNALAAELTCPV
ncbi:unnamed protein product, partial [Hapterophycus canaliculatus]